MSSLSLFIDQYLTILASRSGADPEADLSEVRGDANQRAAWSTVARALQHALRGPEVCPGDRKALASIDNELFSASTCQRRLRYVLWRRAREADDNRKKQRVAKLLAEQQDDVVALVQPTYVPATYVSDFNILKNSVRDEVDAIMAEAKLRLPSIADTRGGENDNESKSDSSAPSSRGGSRQSDALPAIVQVPHAMRLMDENEMRRQQEMGEAEDEMLQRIQDMQLAHFQKYKKWVEAPLLEDDEMRAMVGGAGAVVGASKSAGDSPQAGSVLTTVADVAALLKKLDIEEYASKFRRTSGTLLLDMSKDEITERFNGDTEARDLLWHELARRKGHVEHHHHQRAAAADHVTGLKHGGHDAPAPAASSASAPAARAGQASTAQLHALLDALSGKGAGSATTTLQPTAAAAAPASASAAGGQRGGYGRFGGKGDRRPPRPSQMAADGDSDAEEAAYRDYYGDQTMDDDENFQESTKRFLEQARAGTRGGGATASSATAVAAAAAPPPPRHADPAPAAASRTAATAPAAAPAAAAAATGGSAQRNRRWQVMEYDDDE